MKCCCKFLASTVAKYRDDVDIKWRQRRSKIIKLKQIYETEIPASLTF